MMHEVTVELRNCDSCGKELTPENVGEVVAYIRSEGKKLTGPLSERVFKANGGNYCLPCTGPKA